MRAFLPDYDLIWIQVPFENGKHILIERYVAKNEDSRAVDFVKGLSFTNL
jgi:hypothetical protein